MYACVHAQPHTHTHYIYIHAHTHNTHTDARTRTHNTHTNTTHTYAFTTHAHAQIKPHILIQWWFFIRVFHVHYKRITYIKASSVKLLKYCNYMLPQDNVLHFMLEY